MKKYYGKTNRHGKAAAAVIIILAAAVLALASCSQISDSLQAQQGASHTQAQQEILVPATKGHIAASLSFVGNLRYKQSTTLAWKTNGVIENVYVKVGDRVKKDDILAELDPDFLSSTVLIAEKNMIDGQEKLEDVKGSESSRMQAYVDLNIKEKALVQAKLEQEALYYPRATRYEMERAWDAFALANLNFNYAKQDYDYLVSTGEGWEGFEEGREIRTFGGNKIVIGKDSRSARERKFEDYVSTYNTLVSAYEKYVWTSGKPSATDYAVAEGNVQMAQKEYEKALETYRSYETLPREKDVAAAEMSLNNAETVYKQRYVSAPFDGVVTAVDAVESYYITRGTQALRIDDMSDIYIPLSISELDLGLVTPGTPVTITVDAVEGKTYAGYVVDISEASAASGNTTYFNALVAFDAPEEGLLAGMTAEVSIAAKEKSDALLIPSEAVSYAEGKPMVTVVNGSERHTIEIAVGIVTGNVIEVTSDNLQEGDQLSVSSISADSLRKLGLNPDDYLSDRPRDFGTDGGRNFPGVASNTASAVTVVPTGTQTADTEKPAITPDAERNRGASMERTAFPETDADPSPGQMPDGQFPEPPGDNPRMGTGSGERENKFGVGNPGGEQRPGRTGDGLNLQENPAPQPTDTVESSEKG